MKAGAVDNSNFRQVMRGKSTNRGIKFILRTLIKAFSMDATFIFKSRDWPHLWPK